MRIAAIQMVARAGDLDGNLAAIAEAAARATAEGAALLVAPELATTGYGAGDLVHTLAEASNGRQVSELARIAARHGITVVAGFAERAGNVVYNSAALVRPDGRRAIYRKYHLYGPYERGLFAPGDRAPELVDVDGVKVGLLICYDVEFPESVRHLSRAGADLVVVPTALPEGEHAAFIAGKILPVRAFENQIPIVYANHAGSDGRFTYAGRSCIAMPDGSLAAEAPSDRGMLIVADYQPGRFAQSKLDNPYLEDLRPALFAAAGRS